MFFSIKFKRVMRVQLKCLCIADSIVYRCITFGKYFIYSQTLVLVLCKVQGNQVKKKSTALKKADGKHLRENYINRLVIRW